MDNKLTITFRKEEPKGREIAVVLPDNPANNLKEIKELVQMQNRFRKVLKDVENLDAPSISDIYYDCRSNCNGDTPWIDHISESERTRFIELYRRYVFPFTPFIRVNKIWVADV